MGRVSSPQSGLTSDAFQLEGGDAPVPIHSERGLLRHRQRMLECPDLQLLLVAGREADGIVKSSRTSSTGGRSPIAEVALNQERLSHCGAVLNSYRPQVGCATAH